MKLSQRLKNDIAAILWLVTTIVLVLSLGTYSPYDPSFSNLGSAWKAQNAAGLFGSFSADTLFQLLGVLAWTLPLIALRCAWQSVRGLGLRWKSLEWPLFLLLLLTLSSLIALHWPDKSFTSAHLSWSGWLGEVVLLGMVRLFNEAGVAVVMWATFIIIILALTQLSLLELGRSLSFVWAPLQLVGQFPRPVLRWPNWSHGGSAEAKAPEKDRPSKHLVAKVPDSTETSVGTEKPPSSAGPYFQLSLEPSRQSQEVVTERRSAKTSLPKERVEKVENWSLPPLSLLDDPPSTRVTMDPQAIRQKAELLVEKLKQFSVKGQVVGIKSGPAVTLFEFRPNIDVKLSKITDLADDLSLALSSESIRIIAPIPGRDVVGIEMSNSIRETVYLKDIVTEPSFWQEEMKLPIALGRQANGDPKVVDLRKMPHLLVAGTTGSGKSVFIVSMITSFLFRHSPQSLKVILIDPKQVDLAAFHEVPHLIMPPICESQRAVNALRWAVAEMEKRYRSMSKMGVRSLEAFNQTMTELDEEELQGHREVNQALEDDNKKHEQYYCEKLPYILVVVEEFGDLMAVDKGQVEQLVVRLAQMARACGIHLVLAMQSPRKDVVTGLIKTNIPGRISFKVASKMDSRIILDESGGERLLAQGDMLFLAPGVGKPMRHHGPWLREEEISSVTHFWSEQGQPVFEPSAIRALDGDSETESESLVDEDGDERYDEILAEVAGMKEISASLLQRKFRLGYPRAARMIEIFERQGIVGPPNGSKPRQVLVDKL